MANNPRKMKDPTEAALSAIQDALNLREPPPQSGSHRDEAPIAEPPTPTDLDFAPRATRAPAMDEELFRDQHQRESQLRDQRESQLRESQLPLPGSKTPRSGGPPMTTASRSARSCRRCSSVPRAPPT